MHILNNFSAQTFGYFYIFHKLFTYPCFAIGGASPGSFQLPETGRAVKLPAESFFSKIKSANQTDLRHIQNRGRGIRTPINGFGDRCSAIELFPSILLFCRRFFFPAVDFYIIAYPLYNVKCFFYFFNLFYIVYQINTFFSASNVCPRRPALRDLPPASAQAEEGKGRLHAPCQPRFS